MRRHTARGEVSHTRQSLIAPLQNLPLFSPTKGLIFRWWLVQGRAALAAVKTDYSGIPPVTDGTLSFVFSPVWAESAAKNLDSC